MALVLVAPTGAATDKCDSAAVSTNCAHQCSTKNGVEKCETCSYHVSNSCVLDTNVGYIELAE